MIAKRLHLIDGTYELFRANFSKRPDHTAPSGLGVKGVVGLVASLLALLHDEAEAVTHVGVAFDNPIRSFRNDLFDGYKSDEGLPEEIRVQLVPAEARRGDFAQVRILTPDKDLGQCLDGARVVQVDRLRTREIDEAALRAQRGIAPRSIPDLLALVGDTADGIPGLPGIGDKTAGLLLGRYGHLESIPAAASDWDVKVRGAEAIAATLREQREAALLYRRLATLVEDVPLPQTSPDDLAFRGVPRHAFEQWCDQLGVTTLKRRPTRWGEG